MASQIQYRGGTTAEHASFTGAAREITVDTTKNTIVVHDGTTAGGSPLARESDLAGKAALSGANFTGVISMRKDQTGYTFFKVENQDGTAGNAAGIKLTTPNGDWDIKAQRSGGLSVSTPTTPDALTMSNAGQVLVGAVAAAASERFRVNRSGATPGQWIAYFDNGGTGAVQISAANAGGANVSNTVLTAQVVTATNRSINAAGTINASGADYAEYMTKAECCGQIAKGQIVGVNVDGRLTDKWAESVSFLIKSTDPSYVGGDVWGSEEALGMSRPVEPEFNPPAYDGAAEPESPGEDATDEELADYERAQSKFEQDRSAHDARVEVARKLFDAAYPTYLQHLATFEAALDAARQKVDRIAFAGQVPVNVVGAVPGQYVVPVQDGDGIGAVLVDEDDMTLKQYMKAVGIVQNVLPDGRANVRVKVA